MNSYNTTTRYRLARLGVAIVLVTGAFAARTPSAAAATKYTFKGSGWGHDVGMSQYGAKGGAEAGKTYTQILARYYQKTTVAKQKMPGGIRVGLQQGPDEVALTGNGRVDFNLSGETFVSAKANEKWKVQASATGKYRVVAPDGRKWTVGSPKQWLGVRFAELKTILTVGGTRYSRGWLEFNTYKPNDKYVLRTILHLAPFETYLYGVAEMPTRWHKEALKAQVVASRTYAVEKMKSVGLRESCNCHLYDDTRHQVYGGYAKEEGDSGARWRSMVDATAGQVVTYNKQPIKTLYFSSSGGYTENNDNVWNGSPEPYLRGVKDSWDPPESPYMNWSVTYSQSQLQERFSSRASTDVGVFQSLALLDPRGVSGRVIRVIDSNSGGARIVGSKGAKRVGGETLRSVLGLRSALIKLTTSP